MDGCGFVHDCLYIHTYVHTHTYRTLKHPIMPGSSSSTSSSTTHPTRRRKKTTEEEGEENGMEIDSGIAEEGDEEKGAFSFIWGSERTGYMHLYLYTYIPGNGWIDRWMQSKPHISIHTFIHNIHTYIHTCIHT